ncbi:hypothetical protein [Pseudalkalibacillus berkeleyi]|uniref:Extracellular protein n=1 Tax=Pseudalkalibacillus berkeleyi TaxID=1069813 RepID=A0ABS9H2S1_9BACL|nr:hypothetical protein [Pseudalkalibacillus berkeleyi]MCF6138153.1 hypothetical protein [Pseudalkalibacillus berkeleyi]
MIMIIIYDEGKMNMRVLLQTMLLVLLTISIPIEAMAYSYGDPSEEQVAIAYEEMMGYLNNDDYDKAREMFNTVKEEIQLHMGNEVVANVEEAFDAEDKESIINHMQTILVLNISRRLGAIEKKFDDVDKNKVLLAKANATYKVLSPNVQNEKPETNSKIKEEFENALKALGNPGLFGVGEKEADFEGYKESKEVILNELKQYFDLESVEVGHYANDGTSDDGQNSTQSWTDYAQLKNWVPMIVIAVIIIGVVFYVRRRR